MEAGRDLKIWHGEITEPVFKCLVCLIACSDLDKIPEIAKEQFGIHGVERFTDSGRQNACHITTSDNNHLIYFREYRPSIDTIAHEVTHLVMEHARLLGMEKAQASEEFYAYYVGYWVGEIVKWFNENRNRRSTKRGKSGHSKWRGV